MRCTYQLSMVTFDVDENVCGSSTPEPPAQAINQQGYGNQSGNADLLVWIETL